MKVNRKLLLNPFSSLPSVIESYFQNIPNDYLDIKRNIETWTIREHIYHIVEVQKMLYNRMQKIKREDYPEFIPYFPEHKQNEKYLYKSIKHAFLQYHKYRKKQIELIDGLRDYELVKEAKHPEYRHYNISIIINHMVFHEYWHMYRIEEIWLTKDEYFH